MIRTFILIMVLGLPWTIPAQTLIKGKVINQDGESIPGTNVYIDHSYDGASADVNGFFEFSTDLKGPQILKVESLGYEPVILTVTLDGKVVLQDVVMKEAFNALEAVEITAGSFEAGDKKRAIELTSMDVATTAGAMGDIVAAINTLPGTTRVGESGRLFVRGGSSEETKTFVDDLLVGSPYYSSAPNIGTRGRFNPFLFSGTVFNTGGYSAEYGQALSSVLLLNTNNAKIKDEVNVSLIAGLGADANGTKSWDNGSATVTASYFNLAPYIALVKQQQDWNKPMEMISNEINIKQQTGKSGLFKWYSNINQSQFSLNQRDLDHPGNKIEYDQKNKYYFVNTTWRNNINEQWQFFSGLSITRNRDKVSISGHGGKEELNVVHVKSGLDFQWTEKINIRFGGEYFNNQYSQSVAYYSGLGKNRISNNLASGWAEANMYTSTRFVVRAGGRMEYSELLKKANYSGRASMAYKLDDVSQVSFAGGTFYQLPQNLDLVYDKRLTFEKAHHYLLNYQRTISSRIFRAELFYKRYSDLVCFDEPVPFSREGFSNKGNGYAKGLDLFFRDAKSIKNGHYWISYSLLQTERLHRNFPERTIPGFASKHNFSVVYKHFSQAMRSMISTDFSYSSPRVYHNPNEDGFNNARTKSYQSMNVSWAYLYKSQVIFYAAVNNVLGRQNQFGYRYSSQPGANGKYASEAIVPGAPRFYLLGVFLTFSKDKTRNQLDKIN